MAHAETLPAHQGPTAASLSATFNPYAWIVGSVFAVLALPLVATLGYALATRWGATLVPDGLTLAWFVELWTTPRFVAAFARSLAVAVGALALSLVLVMPVALLAHTRYPWLDRWMNTLILMPFAVPPVVSSVGLLKLYAGGPLPLVGTPWILIPTYFTIVLPFMYRAIANSLRAVDVQSLMDAAQLLGAGPLKAFFLVILPNLRGGVQIAIFLSFSFLVGEFVFANMLVGTRFETLQVYLNNMRGASGHFTSALVITLFAFTLILTWLGNRQAEHTITEATR
ncbi:MULTISPECIES: ABC transporter permease [unclassified Halomonas]|uniref:ABC transporter permease n=1 Tax=unclassified Halomonas TaxID=2609666 RepID=UPI000A052470|nr:MULTISPECIES: ABC transporter permease [unclassified Halomonas]MCJ8287760.1 ABC transporter permease [Halomonas sp.]MCO7217509.1 ABC transporter permease [Halomonas sp. OfavH-34-E]NQY72480.1 ABC transporter permease [Halomonas sp.]